MPPFYYFFYFVNLYILYERMGEILVKNNYFHKHIIASSIDSGSPKPYQK